MSYEVIQKVGRHQYIYLAEGYRNENGQPRQKRRPIGKIDPVTGQKVYKPEYLAQLHRNGAQSGNLEPEGLFSAEDIRKSSVRSYGSFYLYRKIAERNGMVRALMEALPACWTEYFTLACYMVSAGDPLMYCEDWLKDTESYPVGSLSSQRISELLLSLPPQGREAFYGSWHAAHNDVGYLALDITSESSYSELIEDVEWGYNRDHEQLPQVNLCMMVGETSRLPVHQTVYAGSHKDVRTLVTSLSRFEAATGKRPATIVMDKGFFSAKNINFLLGDSDGEAHNFLISMPFTCAFAKKQVESERKDIDCVENTIVVNGYPLRAVTKLRAWNKDHKVYTHIYYSAKKASGIREDLYAKVALLKQRADAEPEKCLDDGECRKYLIIRRSEKQASGYTVSIRSDVLEKVLYTAGWVVLISNNIPDALQAMCVYRDKDVVEKSFLRLKNSIDLGRLRVHSDNAMQGKLFVGFLASILMAEINKTMDRHGLYKKYTMKELVNLLAKLRVQDINGRRILYPVSKEQRIVYEAFDVELPTE